MIENPKDVELTTLGVAQGFQQGQWLNTRYINPSSSLYLSNMTVYNSIKSKLVSTSFYRTLETGYVPPLLALFLLINISSTKYSKEDLGRIHIYITAIAIYMYIYIQYSFFLIHNIGFPGKPTTSESALELLNWAKSLNLYVTIGVPYQWKN